MGGQALADGVLMRTARAWAIARADGEVTSGTFPPSRWSRVPVIRVLVGLVQGLRLGFGPRASGGAAGGSDPARRTRRAALWRPLLGAEAIVLLAGWALGRAQLPAWARPFETAGIWVLALAAFRLLTPAALWRYHGAEHKAVAAHETGVALDDLDGVLACPRVHPRCGTNLMVWVVVLLPLLARLPGAAQVLAIPLALGAVAEVLGLAARHPSTLPAWILLLPGRLLQRFVTTREPVPAEQQVGCRALAACLAAHRAVLGANAPEPSPV